MNYTVIAIENMVLSTGRHKWFKGKQYQVTEDSEDIVITSELGKAKYRLSDKGEVLKNFEMEDNK